MRTRRGLRATLMVIGLVAGFAAISFAIPSVVSAHAEFDRSNPPAGAVVRSAPERLDAWFTQELFKREGENALEVTNEAGERVDDGVTVVDEMDRTHMSVGLPADLAPGVYTVSWRTLSATDGDPANGSFTFTIDPNAPDASTPTPSSEAGTSTPAATTPAATSEPPAVTERDNATPFPWWIVVAGAGILAAGVAGAWVLRLEPPRS